VQETTYRSKTFFSDLGDHKDRHVHLILIATKPDIIKQVPLYLELKKRGQLTVLGHTGQHYDENLSGGMLKEFGVEPDFNLNVRGQMHEVVSQIIGRLGFVIGEMKKRGKIVIPYVHGDTTTAMAGSNAGFCHGFASVHVEAGLRTLTPRYHLLSSSESAGGGRIEKPLNSALRASLEESGFEEWREFLMEKEHWARGSLEPYPEQFNTRCSEAGTGVHLAPVSLNRDFMLGEGFPEDRIFVTGNSVADAVHAMVRKAGNAGNAGHVFERHPELASGDFVRFCIHRRENCVSELRFRSIYGAMKKLIEKGRKVLLINMIQTKAAFERFGLTKEVETLAKKHPNFILSEVWPEYTDVIAAMTKAAVCATDSGSMQEEMNILGIPCVTLRFGSDRSESVFAGGNVIAPPIDADSVTSIIEGAWNHPEMRKVKNIYGEGVSEKSVEAVLGVLEKGEEIFRTEEGRLGIDN
jgi:UDP-N-acetylglucosamine 2-epimerase (non-hydrolysing)